MRKFTIICFSVAGICGPFAANAASHRATSSANAIAAEQSMTKSAIIATLQCQVMTLQRILASYHTTVAAPADLPGNDPSSRDATIAQLQGQVTDLLKQVATADAVSRKNAYEVQQTVLGMSGF